MSPRGDSLRTARLPRPAELRFDAQVKDLGIVATWAVLHGEPRVGGAAEHGRVLPVRVRDLVERFMAGDGVLALAEDFALSVQQVEDALRYAMLPKPARDGWLSRQLQASAREGT